METHDTKARHLTRYPAMDRALAYGGAVVVVFLAVGLAFLLKRLMPHASLSLLFLTGVLLVSAYAGLGPSLLASVLSFLALNLLFTAPYYTLAVADEGDLATLAFFLIMATVSGNVAARMHQEMAKRRASLQRISNLYAFSRRVSSAAGTDEVLDALADHLTQSMDRAVCVYVADATGSLHLRTAVGRQDALRLEDVESAWSQQSSDPYAIDPWHFLKLTVKQGPIGMVAVHQPLDAEQTGLARSLCDQAAVALDRIRLVSALEQARLISETEQLRSALLSSVSHDLRTPLASIIGSTTSLLEYGESFSAADRRELLTTVVEEAQRLDRHIQNLLDMTRLGQGRLTLQRDWVDLHDIVSGAAGRLGEAVKDAELKIDISSTVPLLWVHGALIEQALVNVLDNAVRFTPPEGKVTLKASADGLSVEIDVCDEGPGIPENARERVFDMFYTLRHGDRSQLQGTGLGLAICRGMIAAHGGNITARAGANGRGTCMHIVLPIVRPEELNGA